MIAENAREIAHAALTHLASNEEELNRFLALTGIDPGNIRVLAQDDAFLAGVLDHFLGFEPALLKFAEAAGTAPDDVVQARHALGGPPEAW